MSLSLMLRGRQSGKTHTIIALMQKNPESIVIVPWLMMADAYVKAGIARDRVFSVETLDRLRGRKVNSSAVFIDNLELVLPMLLPVLLASGSGHLDIIATATGLAF
jgi:hypothetical protein